jgi:hypothetical protein
MKQPYPYLLPQLKRLLDENRRRLFLKGSRVRDAMQAVEPTEIASYRFGTFPAIEALALAVLGGEEHARLVQMAAEVEGDDMALARSYAIRTVLQGPRRR